MIVRDCKFSAGRSSHLYGDQAELTAINITIYDSDDTQNSGSGHGIHCYLCRGVISVIGSRFFNLKAYSGAAIHLQDMRSISTLITNNTFDSNQAESLGGAI